MPVCVDEFLMGCDACCSESKPVEVRDSRGGCVPVLHDENVSPPEPYDGGVITHSCRAEEGGTKTIGAPQFELTITNPADDVLRNPDGSPVLVNGETQRK